MISDEIRERFTETTVLLYPFAFILETMPLLARYDIARVLRREPCIFTYADSGTDLRRLELQQLRLAKILTQRDGASMLDPTHKISSA